MTTELAHAQSPAPPNGGMSFRAKLVAGACLLVVLTGVATTLVSYRTARANARSLSELMFREVSQHAVTHARGHVFAATPVIESLRNLADTSLPLEQTDALARQFLAVLKANPGLTWISYGDEQGSFTGVVRQADGTLRVNQSRIANGRTELVERDVLPSGEWRVARQESDTGYDPRTRPYYTKAAQHDQPVWLEPYPFYLTGVPGISCAAAVRNAGGRLRGVLSVDFDLRALSDFVSRLSLSEHSRVFVFTRDLTLLADPHLNDAGKSGQALPTLATFGDPLVQRYRQHLKLAPGEGAFEPFAFDDDGKRYLASATTFAVGDDQVWVVGAMAPESDFLTGIWRAQAMSLGIAAAAVVLGAVLAVVMARAVSRPIEAMIGFTRRVGAGQLDAKADLQGGREFRELSSSLNQMIEDLRDRLRLRHSLNLAMEVQQRLLPQSPPTVPGLDIAGHSTYCDETGGDYYDFLVIDRADSDSGRLLIALGDVMGHGVAAALVMAGARAVLRDRAVSTGSLGEIMSRLNALLADDLGGTRFMTMHLAVIDADAGTYRFASAGHDPAIIYDSESDEFIEIDEGDLPLGVMADTQYAEHRYSPLRAGQVIVIGTDGVWEMPSTTGEQFGKERLREVIRAHARGSAADVAAAVLKSVHTFRGECKPADDVTFVVVKYVGASSPVVQDQSHLQRSSKP